MQSQRNIRRAVAEDAVGIAEVHIKAWREAYAQLLPADTLAALDVGQRAARWTTILADGVADVWVSTADSVIVGWASASEGRDDDAPRKRELEGIYVIAAEYGSGAGQGLLDAALGTSSAYLWMAAGNGRAQQFYERNGFTLDGAKRVTDLAGTPVEIVRMVR